VSYIGNQPTTAAFLTDQFSANGSGTVFTLSAAPANTNSILVSVSGVLQSPDTYSVSGTALTFSAAPPAGTGNISVRFLGIPASGVVTTAYRTQTEFTATAGQTTFSVPSYTAGFIDVYRNGALLGSADFTATNGTTVVLTNAASSGDLVETVSFYVSSVLNAIPATAGAVNSTYLLDGSVTAAKMAASGAWAPAGTVVQVVNSAYSTQTSSTSATFADTGLTASITPKFSTSKILVLVNHNGNLLIGGNNGISWKLLRNGSQIQYIDDLSPYIATGSNAASGSSNVNYLDSPATTSATTYKTQFSNRNATGTVVTQYYGGGSTFSTSYMTLMEITQ
jgi:Pyruvate/2-oxoacid:ferredoxin oxidoreductase gamma subunit